MGRMIFQGDYPLLSTDCLSVLRYSVAQESILFDLKQVADKSRRKSRRF